MSRALLGALIALVVSLPAAAKVQAFPPSFQTKAVHTDGAIIHVRVGGQGPAVVMLHGFADTGDMWAPLAAVLVQNHTVIVPDLRGMGLSTHPEGGYDKKTQAGDIARVLDSLKIQKTDLVTHDIGNMVGYAFAAQNIRIGSPVGQRWTLRFRGLGNGMRSFVAPLCGISISGGLTSNVWSKGASAFTSIASGMSYQPIQNQSTKRPGSTTQNSTRSPAPCIPHSISSLHSSKTRSITRPLSRRES